MGDSVTCLRCGWSWSGSGALPEALTLDDALALPKGERRLLLLAIREVWRKRGCGLAALSSEHGLRVLEAAFEAGPGEDRFHLHPALVAEFAETMAEFAADGRVDAQGRVLPPVQIPH